MDGSYLYKKYQQLVEAGEEVAPLKAPPPPSHGWEAVNEENYLVMATKIPPITSGMDIISISSI